MVRLVRQCVTCGSNHVFCKRVNETCGPDCIVTLRYSYTPGKAEDRTPLQSDLEGNYTFVGGIGVTRINAREENFDPKDAKNKHTAERCHFLSGGGNSENFMLMTHCWIERPFNWLTAHPRLAARPARLLYLHAQRSRYGDESTQEAPFLRNNTCMPCPHRNPSSERTN